MKRTSQKTCRCVSELASAGNGWRSSTDNSLLWCCIGRLRSGTAVAATLRVKSPHAGRGEGRADCRKSREAVGPAGCRIACVARKIAEDRCRELPPRMPNNMTSVRDVSECIKPYKNVFATRLPESAAEIRSLVRHSLHYGAAMTELRLPETAICR